MDKVYTVAELAEEWRCSAKTVRALLDLGKLQGFRVGRHWRIPEEARRAYEQTPAEPAPPTTKPAKRRRAVLEIR